MKILLFDIETAPNRGYTWGKYEQDVIEFDQEWYMLSFAYKWFGDRKVKALALPDYNGYIRNKTDDAQLIADLWKLFDEADIIIGHNGDAFDVKKANARFLFHGLPPPSPYKTIDTLKLARKYFKMNTNRLDDVAKYLGIGRKLQTSGWTLWKQCMEGDLRAWHKMKSYNRQDVVLLDEVYKQLRPWMHNHPNVNMVDEKEMACPACGSQDLQKRGFGYTQVGKYQRYVCTCGKWSKGAPIRMSIEVR